MIASPKIGTTFSSSDLLRAVMPPGFPFSWRRCQTSLSPIATVTVWSNQSPEPTGVGAFCLFVIGFWLLGVTGRRWLSFFR